MIPSSFCKKIPFFACCLYVYYILVTQMAASSSDLRRQLWRQFRASGSLLRQMTQPTELIPGSFYLMHRKCGKPSCRCARGHLYATYVLTRSEAGKHKLYSVPVTQRARVRKLAAAWKRSQKA